MKSLLEYNLNDSSLWQSINMIYVDEYDGNSSTCQVNGLMKVAVLEELRQDVGGSGGERRAYGPNGSFGNYSAEAWVKFKQDCKNQLFPKGYGCMVRCDYPASIKIYEGNHRIRAAYELGLKYMPIELQFFHNSERKLGVFQMPKILQNLFKLGFLFERAGYWFIDNHDSTVLSVNMTFPFSIAWT